MKAKIIGEKVSLRKVAEDADASGADVFRLINHPGKTVVGIYIAVAERQVYDVRLICEKRQPSEKNEEVSA